MKLINVSFDTWCRNHSKTHQARWCRQLYPWHIFEMIDYSRRMIDVQQSIKLSNIDYNATILETYIGENGRVNFLIELAANSKSGSAQWKNIQWNNVFHLVADKDGHFITLFTKKRDPAKSLLGSFMGGNLSNIEAKRCLPYSHLLFQSMVSYQAENLFGQQDDRSSFRWLDNGVRRLQIPKGVGTPWKRESISPLWARGRDRWVVARWSEEKAHRFALLNASQCKQLIVVYCHPTFSRHHRCNFPDTEIVSLLSFSHRNGNRGRALFHRQARFLVNHLKIHEIRSKRSTRNTREIENEILMSRNRKPLQIPVSLLREAKSGLEFEVSTVNEAAYFFSCANLLNAAITGRYGIGSIPKSLLKEVYSFKAKVGEVAESLVRRPIAGVSIYFDRRLMYVKIDQIQFSFHAIARSKAIKKFMYSPDNKRQAWSGIRLQPVSPLVLEWGRSRLLET